MLRIWGTYEIDSCVTESSFRPPPNFCISTPHLQLDKKICAIRSDAQNLIVDLEVATLGPHTLMTLPGKPGCTLRVIKVYYLQIKKHTGA